MALTDGLVSYWKMDGNSTDSHGSNHGTDVNVAYSTGKFNSAVKGNGALARVEVGTDSSLNLTSTMTISFWFRNNNSSGEYSLINRCVSNGGAQSCYEIRWSGAGNSVQILTTGGGPAVGTPSFNPTLGFNHLVVTRNGTSHTWWLNGVAGTPATTATPTSLPTTMTRIGCRPDGYGPLDGFVFMDEIGVWNRVLSASEISQLYNAGAGRSYPLYVPPNRLVSISRTNSPDVFRVKFSAPVRRNYASAVASWSLGPPRQPAPIDTHTIAMWRCDEGLDNANLIDSVSGTYTLTAVGAPLHHPGVFSGSVGARRLLTAGTYFNASSNALSPMAYVFSSASWTVEYWCNIGRTFASSGNLPVAFGQMRAFHCEAPANTYYQFLDGFDFYGDATHGYNWAYSTYYSTSTTGSNSVSCVVPSDRWTHYALTSEPSGSGNWSIQRVYVNGTEMAKKVVLRPYYNSSTPRLSLGAVPLDPLYTVGAFDDIRVSRITRSGSEIMTTYLNGTPSPIETISAVTLSPSHATNQPDLNVGASEFLFKIPNVVDGKTYSLTCSGVLDMDGVAVAAPDNVVYFGFSGKSLPGGRFDDGFDVS